MFAPSTRWLLECFGAKKKEAGGTSLFRLFYRFLLLIARHESFSLSELDHIM
nr:MAG TPA: hypothetical protein [Caudoviricetes sp.]